MKATCNYCGSFDTDAADLHSAAADHLATDSHIAMVRLDNELRATVYVPKDAP